jgi:hypothetical protein
MRSKSLLEELIGEVVRLNIVYIVNILKLVSITLSSSPFDGKSYPKGDRIKLVHQ